MAFSIQSEIAVHAIFGTERWPSYRKLLTLYKDPSGSLFDLFTRPVSQLKKQLQKPKQCVTIGCLDYFSTFLPKEQHLLPASFFAKFLSSSPFRRFFQRRLHASFSLTLSREMAEQTMGYYRRWGAFLSKPNSSKLCCSQENCNFGRGNDTLSLTFGNDIRRPWAVSGGPQEPSGVL